MKILAAGDSYGLRTRVGIGLRLREYRAHADSERHSQGEDVSFRLRGGAGVGAPACGPCDQSAGLK